jgi:hypothetical protein
MEWLGVDRRRLGTGMLVFGLVGMVIAGIVAVALVYGAFAARNLDERLAADQAQITSSLERVSVSMESLATTTANAGTTLTTTSQVLIDAQLVLDQAADTLTTLASALNISILGSQPFATASQRMTELAASVSSFESRAAALGENLHQNAVDAEAMTGRIEDLGEEVDTLSERIDGFDRIGELVNLLIGGIVLAALLTAWVAFAAAFCAWAGWRLRRQAVVVSVPVAEPPYPG